jgi:ubiquinone/menaquinone biosynthesis C-methylase UbiE
MPDHRDQILDQFTRQAVPFSTAPNQRDAGLIGLLVEASDVRAHDRVLDVACGPGLVVRAFAERAARVVGIDMVPAMLDRAREILVGLVCSRHEADYLRDESVTRVTIIPW